MNKILLDTDALFGMYWNNDPHHQTAVKIYDRLSRQDMEFFIINLVVYEAATLISYRLNHNCAIEFIKGLNTVDHTQIFIDEDLAEKAMSIFLSQAKKGTSFVDCANQAAAEKFKIEKIFSFDKFYGQKLLS